jgi:hypothetical protein
LQMTDSREKYGTITGTPLDDLIHAELPSLPEPVADRLVARFKLAKGENDVLHAFRELKVGAAIARAGGTVVYERKIGGKTPDWTLLDDTGRPIAIADVFTFHLEKEKEDERKKANDAGEMWLTWLEDTPRLGQAIDKKIGNYSQVAKAENIPFVVVAVPNLDAGVDTIEVDRFTSGAASVFDGRPDVSGVLIFPDGIQPPEYRANPLADRPFELKVRKL